MYKVSSGKNYIMTSWKWHISYYIYATRFSSSTLAISNKVAIHTLLYMNLD